MEADVSPHLSDRITNFIFLMESGKCVMKQGFAKVRASEA